MYPTEYIQFLAHFHGDRDYFECHEILEEYWKNTDPKDKDSIWVGLILLAVSAYHHRRGNFNGAKRTIEKAMKILEARAGKVKMLGIDPDLLSDLLSKRLALIESHHVYKSFNLPLTNPALVDLCKQSCEQHGYIFAKESDLTNHSLVHRHKTRDRTDIIAERFQALKMRKGNE